MLATALGSDEAERVTALRDSVLPTVLPADWRLAEDMANAAVYRSADGVLVIAEVEIVDGSAWLHVSMSRRDSLPNWFTVRRVKDLFVGRDRKAVQVLPPESEYVNIHPYVLHLYAPLDHDPLPDFRNNGQI